MVAGKTCSSHQTVRLMGHCDLVGHSLFKDVTRVITFLHSYEKQMLFYSQFSPCYCGTCGGL